MISITVHCPRVRNFAWRRVLSHSFHHGQEAAIGGLCSRTAHREMPIPEEGRGREIRSASRRRFHRCCRATLQERSSGCRMIELERLSKAVNAERSRRWPQEKERQNASKKAPGPALPRAKVECNPGGSESRREANSRCPAVWRLAGRDQAGPRQRIGSTIKVQPDQGCVSSA